MCGIAGVISLKKQQKLGTIHMEQLEAMLLRIKDRGPDGKGIDRENDYIVGNRRLKIIGDAQGKQPIKGQNSSLVFNGEIYNYDELCKQYGIKNIYSDTFALFQLLHNRSINILSELNGMFAFCFIIENTIYLVRDRFGEKPLFYTVYENVLYFASEMKAFLDIIDFNIRLSKNYMSLEAEITEETIFYNIFQVEAGCYLEIDRRSKQVITKRYYTFVSHGEDGRSEKQLIEELRYLVRDAVNIRINIEKPIAVYASGGIDSSIIALLSKPKYMFSFLPNSKLVSSEEHFVDILESKMHSTKLVKVSSEQNDLFEHFVNMIYINEGPTTTLGSLAQYFLAREAKKYAINVTLSGIGADELFHGYIRHAIAILTHAYFSGPSFKEYKTLIEKSGVMKKTTSPRVAYQNLLSRSDIPNETLDLVLKENFSKNLSSLSAITLSDMVFTLPPLLHADDYLNMAFGIESRSPFMDYRLAEFALALPEKYKIHVHKKTEEISTKYLLRKAFRDILPQQIYGRKDKIGLMSNIAEMLRNQMRHIFLASYDLLKGVFLDHVYLSVPKDSLGEYSRWEYQICQLAITYLLFTKKYSSKEVYEYFLGHSTVAVIFPRPD